MLLLWKCLIVANLISIVMSVPLEPGQPGGPWTKDEIDIVRDKVIRLMECQIEAASWIAWTARPPLACWGMEGLPDMLDEGDLDEYARDHDEYIGPREYAYNGNNIRYKWRNRGPNHSRLIQLAFHDCLRYEDGSGGCDGCLNWAGMGYSSPRALDGTFKKHPELVGAFAKNKHTSNNKLQLSARSLELIYTLADWPPGAKDLPTSLKESGKSRADLWQFAGNIGLERAINITNQNCLLGNIDNFGNPERQLSAIEGRDKCQMKLKRPIPFRSGRIDCIPDESSKWSPYPFEATKKEKHSNTYGTGTDVLKDLKQDFNLTARETISLMALHGTATFNKNFEESTKYKWIGGYKKGSFSNMYHKILNGKTFWRGNVETFNEGYPEYFIGDKNGNPVGGSSFNIHCHAGWNDTERRVGGPCHFRPNHPGCSLPSDSDLQMRKKCFNPKADGNGYDRKNVQECADAELFEKDGFLYQKGGPPLNEKQKCSSGWAFAMPFEVGFVLNFTVIDNYPRGCGVLDGEWRFDKRKPDCLPYCDAEIARPNKMYIGSPGYDGSPPCGPNTYAPEGETSADIVAKLADDHDLWSKTFFDGWEKIQLNGYSIDDLEDSPENGQLLAPFMCDNSHINELKGSNSKVVPGWTFEGLNYGPWNNNAEKWGTCSKGSWYGFAYPGDGSISTILNGNGKAVLEFGNCWTTGIVAAYLNGNEIASVGAKTEDQIEFDFQDGAEVKIVEHGESIIQFNDLRIIECSTSTTESS